MGERIAEISARCGFELIESRPVSEIDGTAHRMLHTASGARLLFLSNADDNKSFSISFKTPAADDTGVFHILEHSVLCGSDKFPVKEPFVDLLKGSMQTFLNAMTFPDKTMYPVASTNDQDLLNLMDVYLDAVFCPLIYRKEQIFQQEGWHLEVEGADADAHLVYNGVVFNEMKGALSDPDSVLYDTLSAALFPDTTYRFESGGVPASIVDLTYEGFLDSHRRHYRPDNSYIVLYGNVDIERVLAFLDSAYLAPLARIERPALDANPIGQQAPIVRTGVKRQMPTAPENACAALGFVAGSSSQRERLIAADILVDAILGSNEAPMKRALLDAQLADDCLAYLEDGIAQPFVMLELKGLRAGAVERFEEEVRRCASALAGGGLNRQLIEASLAHAEFALREHNMGYADGVVYSIAALSGWLYDDEGALDGILYEDAFASLRQKLDQGYFEELIGELFLRNDHYAQVEIVPVDADPDAAIAGQLRALEQDLTAEGLARIAEAAEALHAAQLAPDAPEALATLPRLGIDQIGDAPAEPPFELEAAGDLPCLRHRMPTHGIAYAYRYFPLEGVAFEELPYVALLSLVLGKMDTRDHTAAEIDLLVQRELGNLSFFTEVHEHVDDDGFEVKLVVSASALSEKSASAARLADEVMLRTDFCGYDKLRDVLMQRRVAMEQAFASSGNATAARRAASYYLPAACVREQLGGVDFYRFLKRQIDGFDEGKEALAGKLAELAARIFSDDGCLLSFAGSDAGLAAFMEARTPLPERAERSERLVVPAPVDKREALVVPSDVSYTALAADRRQVGAAYSGVWPVISRALTYSYLWQEVRVLGGAYGTGFSTTVPGPSSFYSFRDPRVDETVERFRGAGAWLSGFAPEAEEFTGFIVSSVAGMDAPCKPRELMRRQDGMHFSGYTPERRARTRSQVLACTPADVRAAARAVDELASGGCVCSVGGRDILSQSQMGLELVDLVG